MKLYHSAAELAERYGVSVRSVQQLASLGKIPGALRVGAQWRFKASEIQAWENSSGDQGRPIGMSLSKIRPRPVASNDGQLSEATRQRLERLQRHIKRSSTVE